MYSIAPRLSERLCKVSSDLLRGQQASLTVNSLPCLSLPQISDARSSCVLIQKVIFIHNSTRMPLLIILLNILLKHFQED